MRSASACVRLMLTVALLLVVQTVYALWRALELTEGTAIAVYHTVAGLCRHVFRPNTEEAASAAALVLLGGAGLALYRLARHVILQLHRTRGAVDAALTARLDVWPDALANAAQRLDLTRDLDLLESSAATAFSYGLMRPRICISTGLIEILGADELDAVLVHERHHCRQHDPLKVLLTGALAQAFFFLPAMRDLQARYDADKEFAADAAAVQFHGAARPISGALYKVLRAPTTMPDLRRMAVSGLSVTERRIDHLLTPGAADLPPVSSTRLLLSGAVLSLVSLAALTLSTTDIQPILHGCRL